MTTKRALAAIFAITFVEGALAAWLRSASPGANAGLFWGSLLINSFLFLFWAQADAKKHAYPPSRALDVGIFVFAPVFVPVYLVRLRERSQRLKAIGGFLLTVLAYLFAATCGTLLGILTRTP